MKRILIYGIIPFLSIFCCIFGAFAAGEDNGTDANDKLIVSEVLALRCGLSSKDPAITMDCLRFLAYDNKTGTAPGYDSYEEEKRAIIDDYASVYLRQAIVDMIAAGKYDERIDKLIGQDPEVIPDLDGDAREDIEASNKLSSDNSSRLLDAINLRASSINLNHIMDTLNILVPAIDISENGSVKLLPSQGEKKL